MTRHLSPSPSDLAEACSKRRTRILWTTCLAFVAWQSGHMATLFGSPGTRYVDRVALIAWLVWVAVLLLVLATGGGLRQSKEVRELMNDELSNANRHDGIMWGFWAAMLTGVGIYAVGVFTAVPTRETLHAVLTAGLGFALFRFAYLEHRAERAH